RGGGRGGAADRSVRRAVALPSARGERRRRGAHAPHDRDSGPRALRDPAGLARGRARVRRASLVGSLAAIAIAAGGRASSARDAAASPTPSPTSPPALLTVSTGAPGEPWTLRVENTGERPFR